MYVGLGRRMEVTAEGKGNLYHDSHVSELGNYVTAKCH